MSRNSPFLSRFFSEPLYGMLPAAIASVVCTENLICVGGTTESPKLTE